MKKLRMWAVLAFVSFLIGGSVQLRKPISNVVLKNVEALASVIESGEYVRCYDSGKVDCLNEKVGYKLFDSFGLGDNHETE